MVHNLIAYLIKHNIVIQVTYRILMSFIFRFIGVFLKSDEKLVLLSSYGGKQFSDSPKTLFEAMKKDIRFQNFHYVWAFESPDKYNVPGADKIKIDSLAYFIIALKAKIWITNVNIERGLSFKKSNTIYLNTWHGTGPKKGGNAVKGRHDYDFSRVDILCCDGRYMHDVYLQWFGAKEESLLWCGRPREDQLLQFTEKDRKSIRKKLNIPEDKLMVLYMPTWREYGNKPLSYDKWEKCLKDKAVMCVRSHHFAEDDIFNNLENSFWHDVTLYDNVNELYCAADILISDYSSAFFDYGLLGKPMYCYAYDYDKYKEEYGLFMDLRKEFPNGVMESELDVINAIQMIDYQKEVRLVKEYVSRYVSHPVNATKMCLDSICSRLNK